MAKFSSSAVRTAPPVGPLSTIGPAINHEGGIGHAKDAKSELFTLSVANLVSEATFYESAGDRDDRFRALVAEVTAVDPTWVVGLVRWLRADANMRSASAVAAVEYVRAGGPNGRRVIDSACLQADEPAEVLGYWLSRYGRSVPWPVKRGLADAAARLYTERNVLKYDTPLRGVRFADVVQLAHPTATAPWQNALFRHVLDRRHDRHRDERAADALAQLPMLANAYRLDSLPEGERRAALADADALAAAGFTWERLSGWLPGGMDAAAWEAVIPNMGVMAIIRNLRNFEEAGVRSAVLDQVAARISNPEVVAGSRQFPYRWLSAYLNSGTMRFGPALETALDLSTANIPVLPGRSLVLCDTSGSMSAPVSSRSKVPRAGVAALFAAATAARARSVAGADVVLCPYADTTYRAEIRSSVLRTIQDITSSLNRVGCGTNTWPSAHEAIRQWGPFDRVVVFSDMQDHPTWRGDRPPADIPVYVWDLAGYAVANVDTDVRGHYLFGGFTDAAFRLIPLLEAGRRAAWPWETTAS